MNKINLLFAQPNTPIYDILLLMLLKIKFKPMKSVAIECGLCTVSPVL